MKKNPFEKEGWIVDLRRYDLDEVNLDNWKAISEEFGIPIVVNGQVSEDEEKLCERWNLPSADYAYYLDGYALGFFVDSPYGEEFESFKRRLDKYVSFLNRGGNIPDNHSYHDTSLNFLPIC